MEKQVLKYLSPLLAGIMLMVGAGVANARPMSYSMHHWYWHHHRYESRRENVILSRRYDYLLEVNAAFRHARMRIECGPIVDNPPLRRECLASFAQYEPARYGGYYGYRPYYHRWHHGYRWHPEHRWNREHHWRRY
jgi:hypothetical protein